MANARTQKFTVHELQENGEVAAGNGTEIEITGYSGLILFADAGGTPGTIVYEFSRDGVEWEDLPIYSAATGLSISNTVTENLIVIGEVYDGTCFVRARIPVAWTGGAPLVQAVVTY